MITGLKDSQLYELKIILAFIELLMNVFCFHELHSFLHNSFHNIELEWFCIDKIPQRKPQIHLFLRPAEIHNDTDYKLFLTVP